MKHIDITALEPVAANLCAAVTSPLRLPTLPVLGLEVADATARMAVDAMLSPGRRTVAFLNAHCANVMSRDETYRSALHQADMILPDGIGIELAARMTGDRLTTNLNGTDLVPELLARAAAQGLSVFLFGGTPGTADAAAACLCRDVPGLCVAGTLDGFEGAQDSEVAISAINASGADILLVAMGVPLQDVWLAKHRHRLEPRLQLGVGALFDFLAGNVRRAPTAVRRIRMEWAWRLAQEPRRLASRYLIGNAAFLLRAAWHAAKQKQTATAVIKRGLDIIFASGALLAMAPMLPILIAANHIDSPGPVLFRQTRIGRNGRPFTLYKFRSMHVDAEARRAALLSTSDREGVCFKARADPRVTRIGRFLRRSSLDELPQILNVLRGEMSIVGPRPALPEEVDAFPTRAQGRLSVKPGITGLWQVSGRADIGFEKMIDMDLAYAASRSVLLDLMLIALTFKAVISGRGAY